MPPCIRKQQFAVRHLILLPSTFYHLILFNIIKSMKNMFKNIKNHERCKKYTKMCPNYQPHYHPSLFKSALNSNSLYFQHLNSSPTVYFWHPFLFHLKGHQKLELVCINDLKNTPWSSILRCIQIEITGIQRIKVWNGI